jgi:protein TonB
MKIRISALIAATALSFAASLAIAQTAPKIVKKVPPEFPSEAARASVSSGVVKAKMAIDGEGKVTDVSIVEAEPRKVFDKAVKTALMGWRFEPNGGAQSYEVRLVFKSED